MMTFLGPKQTEEVRGGLTLAVYVRTYIYAAMRRAETGNMETPQNRGTNSDRQVQEQQTSRPAFSARASTRCLSTQLPAGPAPCTLPTQTSGNDPRSASCASTTHTGRVPNRWRRRQGNCAKNRRKQRSPLELLVL